MFRIVMTNIASFHERQLSIILVICGLVSKDTFVNDYPGHTFVLCVIVIIDGFSFQNF